MLQMHDAWQGVAVASQLNSKTPQAQPAVQAILRAVQQLADFCSAFASGESAGRAPPAGVTGAAARKLRPESHPGEPTVAAGAGTAAGDSAMARAGRSRRARRLSRIVLFMVYSFQVGSNDVLSPVTGRCCKRSSSGTPGTRGCS
jgi:hypothetical protein